MAAECLWVIAYDITSDRRRARLERLVSRYAERVQYSVFEGWLNEIQVRELLRRARPLVQPPSDSLRLYRLCGACQGTVRCVGAAAPQPPPAEVIV